MKCGCPTRSTAERVGGFYPWARWDRGLADFRRCSGDGACVFATFLRFACFSSGFRSLLGFGRSCVQKNTLLGGEKTPEGGAHRNTGLLLKNRPPEIRTHQYKCQEIGPNMANTWPQRAGPKGPKGRARALGPGPEGLWAQPSVAMYWPCLDLVPDICIDEF